ncbi:hypothetical protein QW180_22400 [Vibrio sinaloensis]|nr:hypothetical protein [Vibrio sinaloensis]
MTEFVRKLGIQHAAAFMQDWGGMIGLRVFGEGAAMARPSSGCQYGTG